MSKVTDDVSLANAIVSYEDPLTPDTFIVIPQVTATGDVGAQSNPKEKTNLSDKEQKRYGVGLRDASDMQFKGQYTPFQESGDIHFEAYTAQQGFFTKCKNFEEMNIKIEWDDGETDTFLFKPTSFVKDAPNQEEWKMWTVDGKQNSTPETTLPTA